MNNLIWLCGERYCCIRKKNKLIDEIRESFKNIDLICLENPTSKEIYSELNKNSFLENKTKIIIHYGEIEDADIILSVLNKKDIFFIVLGGCKDSDLVFGNDKRISAYKKLSPYLILYEPIIQDNGYPNRNLIKKYLTILKDFTNTEINEETINNILYSCNYNIGMTINEIEKIDIYCENEITNKEIGEIICIESSVNSILDSLLESAINGVSFNTANNISEISSDYNPNDVFFKIIGFLNERINFFICSKMAINEKIKNKEIGDYLYKYLGTSNPVSLSKRFTIYNNYVKKIDINNLFYIIKLLNKAVLDYINSAYEEKYIIKSLLFESYCNLKV